MSDEKDNPRRGSPALSVALTYDGKAAPRVSAKGEGQVAEEIQAIAEAHGVPLHEDKDLVRVLSRVELGDEIPRALYVAVAEVIAFAYMVSGKTPPAPGGGGESEGSE